jgi:hypothetical protein
MMTKDEALKMAIEQLWACSMLMNLDHSDYLYEDVIQALDACKEALERPSNMVVVPLDKLEDMQRRLKALEQPAQEPVTCLDKMQSITEQEYYERS